jgi:hypothetical protein
MYLVIIAWMYVVLMMSVAEATSTTGTLLGAVVTFFLYGVAPAALVAYLMGTPARNRAIKERQAQALAAGQMAAALRQPDAGRHATGGVETVTTAGNSTGVPPMRKEP